MMDLGAGLYAEVDDHGNVLLERDNPGSLRHNVESIDLTPDEWRRLLVFVAKATTPKDAPKLGALS